MKGYWNKVDMFRYDYKIMDGNTVMGEISLDFYEASTEWEVTCKENNGVVHKKVGNDLDAAKKKAEKILLEQLQKKYIIAKAIAYSLGEIFASGWNSLLKKYNINLHDLKDKYDLVVFRCEGCKEDLKQYNPYVYDDGSQIPLEKIKIVLVDHKDCENTEENLGKRALPIALFNNVDDIIYAAFPELAE